MAIKTVVHSPALAGDIAGFTRRYSAIMDTAYGRIASTDYSVGDTLKLVELNMKEIAYARFVAGTAVLEVFNSTSLSSPLAFDVNNAGATRTIDYVIHFVRGSSSNTLALLISSST